MPREQELARGGQYFPWSPATGTDLKEHFTFIVCNSVHFPQLVLFIFVVRAPCITKRMTEGTQVKQ